LAFTPPPPGSLRTQGGVNGQSFTPVVHCELACNYMRQPCTFTPFTVNLTWSQSLRERVGIIILRGEATLLAGRGTPIASYKRTTVCLPLRSPDDWLRLCRCNCPSRRWRGDEKPDRHRPGRPARSARRKRLTRPNRAGRPTTKDVSLLRRRAAVARAVSVVAQVHRQR
jgi:hypothetical protein